MLRHPVCSFIHANTENKVSDFLCRIFFHSVPSFQPSQPKSDRRHQEIWPTDIKGGKGGGDQGGGEMLVIRGRWSGLVWLEKNNITLFPIYPFQKKKMKRGDRSICGQVSFSEKSAGGREEGGGLCGGCTGARETEIHPTPLNPTVDVSPQQNFSLN